MAGKLLSAPLGVSSPSPASASDLERIEVKFQRSGAASTVVNQSEPFRLAQRDYVRQYCHVYSHRLAYTRDLVQSEAWRVLGRDVRVCSLGLLNAAGANKAREKDVVVIGTVYKNQSLKPNILKDLSDENGLAPVQPVAKEAGHRIVKYVSDDDDLILEDDLQRIKLLGPVVERANLVTGVVCGVYGRETNSGKFEVKQLVFARAPEQIERPIFEQDRFIIFLSGLELASDSSSTLWLSSLQLAIDWLCGEAGEMDDQQESARVERVIVAGNSLSEDTRDRQEMSKAKYLTKDSQAGSIDAINLLDTLLAQLAGSVDTDVMPGAFDPANQIMPQQPLHPCLFPLASVYPTLKTVSNPYSLSVDDLSLLGTSGQNTDDLLRNTGLDCPLDALERLVQWSHLAPTCPDTLGCFPYQDKDPFILKQRPHVMFTANQDKFDQRLFKDSATGHEVKLLSIPRFSRTHTFVRLNLKTLGAEEVKFQASLGAES